MFSSRNTGHSKTTHIDEEYHSPTEDESQSDQYDEIDEMEYDGYGEEIKKRKRYLPPSSPTSQTELTSFMKEAKKVDRPQGGGKQSRSKRYSTM